MNVNDFVKRFLCDNGIQEATGVTIKTKDGVTLSIHSDDHPFLNEDADKVAEVTPRQSAQGGN